MNGGSTGAQRGDNWRKTGDKSLRGRAVAKDVVKNVVKALEAQERKEVAHRHHTE